MLGTNPKELQHNRDNLEGQGCISMKLRKAARQTLKDFFYSHSPQTTHFRKEIHESIVV